MKKVLNSIIILFFLFTLSAIGATAQTRRLTDGSTPAGIAPGSPAGSFALSDFESINPYNGNLNFSLPLLSVGGRGNAGYSITLPINRRWTVDHTLFNQSYYRNYPNDDWWRPTAGYNAGIMLGRKVGTGSCPPGTNISETLTRLTFTSPDGTETEFIDQLRSGFARNNFCGSLSRGNVFVTADGSSATFISDTIIYDEPITSMTFNVSGYLLWKDGTRYRIDNSQVSWIRDRNGNTVNFTYGQVTDSLGREINITYGIQDAQYGLHDQITYKGFGGADRTIRVSRSNLSAALRSDQTIKTYGELFDLEDYGGLQYNPQVVSSVWMPDNRRYRLYYNSYGEIARVEQPTGSASEYDWGASLLNGQANGVVVVQATINGTSENLPEIYRRVLTKRIYADGGTGSSFTLKTTFSQTSGQGTATSSTTIQQHDASNNVLAQTKHYFHGNPIPSFSENLFYYPGWNEGREYRAEIFDVVGGTAVLKRRADQTWQSFGIQGRTAR